MDKERELQLNNPLHGLKLKGLLQELIDHFGFEVLAQHININCFKTNPSFAASYKFLQKTEWAREKLEIFYLYKYKRLPKPDDTQYELPPRKRTIYLDQKPKEPFKTLSPPKPKFDDDRPKKAEKKPAKINSSNKATTNPWAKWEEK